MSRLTRKKKPEDELLCEMAKILKEIVGVTSQIDRLCIQIVSKYLKKEPLADTIEEITVKAGIISQHATWLLSKLASEGVVEL